MPTSGEPTADLGRALELLQQLQGLPSAERQRRLDELLAAEPLLAAQVDRMLSPPPTGPLPAGRTGCFGRYRLLAFVGAGGMGEVYRAEQDQPQRTVALKLLQPGPASAAMVQRIQREAKVLARLSHPGIAQVYDAGTVTTADGDEPFLAMEFVDGEPFLAAAARLPLERRIALLAELTDTVEHAHRRGVIHCDLKPDNILLEHAPEGLRLRVLDFGIAVLTAEPRAAGDARRTAGTLAYMGPERIDGHIDVRGDVYSIGAVGYQLLAGQQPVQVRGLSLAEAVQAVRLRTPAPLGNFDRRLRGDLEAIFAKALAKDPEQRYANAGALGADLRRWLRHEPVQARRPTLPYLLLRFARRHRGLTAAILFAVACAGFGIGGTVAAADRAGHLADELSSLTAKVIDEVGPVLDESSGAAHVRREILVELEQRLRTVLQARPDDLRLRHSFADLLQLQGNMARDAGRYDHALELRRRNLAERRALVALQPGNLHAMHDLAIAQVLLGDVHKELGQWADVGGPYDDAHALFLGLARDEGGRRALDDLGCSHLRRADLARVLGAVTTARQELDACAALIQQLTATHPDHRATRNLLRSWNSVESELARRLGDQRARRRHLEAAFQHARGLAAEKPDHVAYQEQALCSANMLAGCLREQGEPGAASRLLDAALDRARLLLDSTDYLPGLDALVWARCERVLCHLEEGDTAGAVPAAVLALEAANLHADHDGNRTRAELHRGRGVEVVRRSLCCVDPAANAEQRSRLLVALRAAGGRAGGNAYAAACTAHALALFGSDADLAEADRLLAAAESAGAAGAEQALIAARLCRRHGDDAGARAALQRTAAPADDRPLQAAIAAELARTTGR